MPTNVTVKLEAIWGARVRDRRKLLGLTQTQLAELMEPPSTQGTIHKVETGQITPRDSLKQALAGALRCKPDALFPWSP